MSTTFCVSGCISVFYIKFFRAFCTILRVEIKEKLCYLIDTRGDTNDHVKPPYGSELLVVRYSHSVKYEGKQSDMICK